MKQKVLLLLLILFTISCNKEDNDSLKENTNSTLLLDKLQNELIKNQYEQKDHFDWVNPIIAYNSNKEPYIIELESKKTFKNKIAKIIFNINEQKVTSQVWVLSFADESVNTEPLRHLRVHEILLDFYGTLTVYDINSKLSKQIAIESPILKTNKYSAQSNPHAFRSVCSLCHQTLDEIVIGGPGSGGGWDRDFGSESDIGVITGGGYSGGSKPPLPPPAPELIIKDQSFKNNDCLNTVFTKLGGTNIGKRYTKGFELDSDPTIIYFAAVFPSYKNGETKYNRQTRKYEVYINKNTLNRPEADIARTILHETIHANIEAYLHERGKPTQNNFIEFKDLWEEFYTRDITDKMPTLNEFHHNYMANNYLNILVNGMSEYLGSNNPFTQEELLALAWQGLYDTSTWRNLTNQEQNEILKNREEALKKTQNNLKCQ
jgi:hypothetical protein